MHPGAPIPSQHRRNLTPGKQPNLVAIYIFYRQQLAGRAGKPHFVPCDRILIPIRRPGRCASFKGSQVCQQAIHRFMDLGRVQRFQKIIHCLQTEDRRQTSSRASGSDDPYAGKAAARAQGDTALQDGSYHDSLHLYGFPSATQRDQVVERFSVDESLRI
jgi:hypothetical protein